MKTQAGMEVQLHTFLTLASDGDELSASRPCYFGPSTHGPEGWMDATARLNLLEKKEVSCP
jgi:hypothetical protein